MSDRAVPPETDAPSPADIAAAFRVYETRSEGDSVRYVGEPLAPPDEVYERLCPVFRRAGYDVQLRPPDGRGAHVLVAEPLGVRGVPWTNLVLFLATVVSTLFVGATVWYYVPLSVIASDPSALLRAWPFTAAVLACSASTSSVTTRRAGGTTSRRRSRTSSPSRRSSGRWGP
jgi:hypothetical protein